MAIGLFVLVPSASAVSVSSACQLQGTANFSPGLSTSSQPFEYGFAGTLSGCQSQESGLPTSGTIEVGQTVTEKVKNSITGATDTVAYREPVAGAEGTCASSNTIAGRVLETWSDGTHTVVTYTTTGAVLRGTVAPTMSLEIANEQQAEEGDPAQYEIKNNRFKIGESVEGLLAFLPSEPSACASAGATTAAVNGAMTILLEPPKAPLP